MQQILEFFSQSKYLIYTFLFLPNGKLYNKNILWAVFLLLLCRCAIIKILCHHFVCFVLNVQNI